MLTEFAFTPSIFDEDAHEDKETWREHLKELGRNMFPRVSAWPVVVSDLYASSWYPIADQTVKRIKDQKARLLCEGILQNIKKSLVPRPVCGDWPDDDAAWGREAIASHNSETIDRMVANQETRNKLLPECNLIRSLEEVEDSGFWRGITADVSPKMIIAEQIKLLRKLCLHAEWVAWINPYTWSTETEFALNLQQVASTCPLDFGSVKLELHTQGPQDCRSDSELQERLGNVKRNISRRVKEKLSGAESVNLYFWPKLTERVMLAGVFSQQSDGAQQKSPRWGVSMTHIARVSDESTDPPKWNLLRREDLDYWFRKYVSDEAVDRPEADKVISEDC